MTQKNQIEAAVAAWKKLGEGKSIDGEEYTAIGFILQAALQPAAQGWRDISTAPRDGTWILIYYKDSVHFPIQSAKFTDFGAWETTHAYEECQEYPMPTHWIPLPLPPKNSAGGAE